MNPRLLAEEMERRPLVPAGAGERFAGYGVMGLPFASGHVLAFRRMTASSLGPAYTTVWHRDPYRHWTFFTDIDPRRSCPRFFGGALDEVVVGEIELSWDGPFEFSLRIPEARFHWGARLSSDLRTRSLSALGRVAPAALWRNERVLSMVGRAGGGLLGLGNLALAGSSPNRQRYRVAPRLFWRVEATAAILHREDLGEMAPLPEQTRLGDFWIPNAGIFAIGETRFESFDPEVHSSAITRPRSPVSLLMDRETEGKKQKARMNHEKGGHDHEST